MKVRATGLLLGLLGLCACEANDAPQKCEELLDLMCTRLVECAIEPNQADCLAAAKTVAPCAKAVSVDGSYDACLKDIRAQSCTVLMSSGIPANCDDVINIQP
jgi:hypothetical protein